MLKIALTADVQYAEKPIAMGRYYSASLEKLKEAADFFTRESADFWIDLGDVIDEGFEHFEPCLRLFGTFPRERFHLAGNHDFYVEDSQKAQVYARLGIPEPGYYSLEKMGYRFLFLDGNDISLHRQAANSPLHRIAQAEMDMAKEEGLASANFYNGALGQTQLLWLKEQLDQAKEDQKKVLIFCHFPVLPNETHALWNGDNVLRLLRGYPDLVKAWFCGHKHAGDFDYVDGIHFLNLCGMVQGADNAFALLIVRKDGLELQGHGRQPNYNYTWGM